MEGCAQREEERRGVDGKKGSEQCEMEADGGAAGTSQRRKRKPRGADGSDQIAQGSKESRSGASNVDPVEARSNQCGAIRV